MKTIKTTILFSLITIGFATAQIDTTDWFPVQTNNYWEYWDNTGNSEKLFVKVLGDSTLINGMSYKIFRYYFNNWLNYSDYFFRKDNAKVYIYDSDPKCMNSERLLYEFDIQDSLVWEDCININNNVLWYRCVLKTEYNNTQFYPSPLLSKTFSSVTVDTTVVPADTSWFALGLDKIIKGIGLYESIYDQAPWYLLAGAIINNTQFGIITNIDQPESKIINPTDIIINVYPNPFNSQTILQINNSDNETLKLSIYNSMGEQLVGFNKEFNSQNMISHKLSLSNYPSGIYFLHVTGKNKHKAKKIINLK